MLTEHYFNNQQSLNSKTLMEFVRNIMSIELEGLSGTVVQSKQFKDIFVDHYRSVFKQALAMMNINDDPLGSRALVAPDLEISTLPLGANGISTGTFYLRYKREFQEISKLGSGGFGAVYLSRNLLDNQNYAIKRINFSISLAASVSAKIERVLREVKALARLDHKNILRYYHAWIEVNTQVDGSNFSSVDPSRGVTDDNLSTSFDMSEDVTDTLTHDTFVPRSRSLVNLRTLDSNDEEDEDDDEYEDSSDDSEDEDSTLNYSREFNPPLNKSLVPYQPPKLTQSAAYLPTTQPPANRAKYTLYVQTQYCDGKTLRDWLDSSSRSNRTQESIHVAMSIFKQTLAGLHYLHSMGMVHRDIKPANIFLTKDMKVSIGDLGLVKDIPLSSFSDHPATSGGHHHDLERSHSHVLLSNSLNTHGIGTLTYASPEQLSGSVYSNKVDIYSLGIILFELLYPFNTMFERSETIKHLKEGGKIPDLFMARNPYEAKLIKSMVSPDPEQRPTTETLIKVHLPHLLRRDSIATTPSPKDSPLVDYNGLDSQALVKILQDKEQQIADLQREVNELRGLKIST
eukprot:gene19918-23871_t